MLLACQHAASAISTMPTAPSTIFWRAAMIALACWRCSIACGDLRGVGQVADPRLDHLDAGLGEPLLDLGLEVLGDLGGVGAQRHLAVVVGVVGVAAWPGCAARTRSGRARSSRSRRPRRAASAVSTTCQTTIGGDLDRVAVEVVDLQALALEVAHAQRDASSSCRTGWPSAAPRLARRALVAAEELETTRLVRADREQAEQQQEHEHDREDPEEQGRDAPRAAIERHHGLDEHVDRARQRGDQDHQRDQAGNGTDFLLTDHRCPS